MDLVWLLIYVLLVGAACYGLMWVVDWIGLPPPFQMFAKVIVAIILLVLIIGFVTGYTPSPKWLRIG